MEAFIGSYALPYEPFRELMRTTNALVAGSAALSLYLQQEGQAGFEPGDLDIWVEDTRQLVASSGAYQQFGNRYLFINFLIKNGYNVVCKYEPKAEYESLRIREILSFVNRERKVQVILLAEKDLKGYMREFDLSVCMSWWDARTERCETLWPETLGREMFIGGSAASHASHANGCLSGGLSGGLDASHALRQISRIQKYEERGFRLIERPCPAMGKRDGLVGLEELAGKAFDTISYEEVDCAEFLRSSWHVLLRVGEQFHAFHRNDLAAYLEKHSVHHPHIGKLYDTPHKQTITESAKGWLQWSDYAIVVLTHGQTVDIGNHSKSLHECCFYTVEEWTTDGAPGVICEVPSLEALERCPVRGPLRSPLRSPSAMSVPSVPLYHEDVYWMDG